MRITILLLLLTISSPFCAYSQLAGNALNFDASNGYCTANLPTVFDNIPSNDFTIECWVKQELNATSKRVFFAQKDANNFCSVLVNTSNVAYFFLRENGTYYSVNTQVTLSISEWTHLAFTWDASTNTISSYINGIQITGLSGGSSSLGNDGVMTIGARSDGQQVYKGSIDELRIWDDIRTPCEIFGSVTSQAGITQTNNNSETYLSNDIVTACGSYTWIDENTYFADNHSATYTYISVTGCDSTVHLDLTIDAPVTADSLANVSECAYFELPVLSNGAYFTATNGGGTPLSVGDSILSSQTLYVYAENGTCSDENSFLITIDSVVTADSPGDVTACDSYELPALTFGSYFTESNGGGTLLTAGDLVSGSQTIFVYTENGTCSDENSFAISINETPLNTVSVAANILTADQTGATYQWLDCTNGNTPIAGATGLNYSPTMNGSYAVEIAENGCVDTSACVNITTIGIDETTFTGNITLFPNPTSGMLTIVSDSEFGNASLTVRNVLGQEVYRKVYSSVKQIDLNLEGAVGVYSIEIVDGSKVSLLKVIKE